MSAVKNSGRRRGSSSRTTTSRDQFPAGMRILLVDDCSTSLAVLKLMLNAFKYDVTGCTRAKAALDLLRERKAEFDMVMTDVHMPEMDGFQLLQAIGLEIDIPVVMISGDARTESIIKGIKNGACDYLVKPGTIGQYKNIWQHVYRKKLKLGLRNKNKRHDEETDSEETATKKMRVKWTTDLHQKFAYAVNQMGIDKAVPKKILELMNVPNLTKEHVASHLQKFRKFVKKNGGQWSTQISPEMLASANAGTLRQAMDLGGWSGNQNDSIIPEHSPIQLQESSHPFNLQPSHLLPDQPPNIFEVTVQPQECRSTQISPEMLTSANVGTLCQAMDLGGWSGNQNDSIIPEHSPIQLQESSHPFNLQPSHLLPDQPPNTFQVTVQPQEWSNFQSPILPLLAQPVSNYCIDYNPLITSQAENVSIPIVHGPNYNVFMGQMPAAGLRYVEAIQNYSIHSNSLMTENYISSGLARPNTENNDNLWLGVETLADQEKARNLGFVGEGACIAIDGVGSQDLGNNEDVGEYFLSDLLNSRKEDVGPDV